MLLIAGGASRLISRSGATAADLSLVKEHIGLTHNSDDTLLNNILLGAITEIENRASIALTTQVRRYSVPSQWAYKLSGYTLYLPFNPIQSIDTLTYLDSDDAPQTDFTDYRLVQDEGVYFKSLPPVIASGDGSIYLDYTCGFGDDLADVPEVWQVLVNQLCFRRYEFRDTISGQNDRDWERAFDSQIVAAGGERFA